MDAKKIHDLAVGLAQRRNSPPGVGYYLRRNWKRHLLFVALYGMLIAACMVMGFGLLALFIAGFLVGRQTRDLQWYRSLASEWPTTAHFIDWQKVEAIAKSPAP